MKRLLLPFAAFLVLGLAGGVGGVVLRLRLSPTPAAAAVAAAPKKDSASATAKDSTRGAPIADSNAVVAKTSTTGATTSARVADTAPPARLAPPSRDTVKSVSATTTAKVAIAPTPDSNRVSIAERLAAAEAADSIARVAQQRLGKVLGSMPAKDAARVIEKLADVEAATALSYLKEKQAAAIIANLPSERAAAMLRAGLRRAGGER